MRLFTNEEASRESGLSRGQIDQFISRWGYAVYGARLNPTRLRCFAGVDMFNLMVAGQLSRLGLTMPVIRDIVVGGLGLYRWDRASDMPAEHFPGQLAASPGPCALVLFKHGDDWHCRTVSGEPKLHAHGPAGTVSIVIDASGLAERITQLAYQGRAA